jgi:hypothetical protein
MEKLSALKSRYPVFCPERLLFDVRNGAWFVETIRASGQMCRANRPDTRQHLTMYQSLKKGLQSRSHPHRTKRDFAATAPNVGFIETCTFAVHAASM